MPTPAMKGNFKLHAVPAITPMLDDDKALMHVTVSQGGVVIPLPAGMALTWTPDANIKVDPTVGIDGKPSTDPEAAVAIGVKGFSGPAAITVTLPANPDGTIPTTVFAFTMAVDPASLDNTLDGSVDPPVKQ
jgi:hypothetical protein